MKTDTQSQMIADNPDDVLTDLETKRGLRSGDLLALEAVLVFHSGSPWDSAKRQRWDEICGELLPKGLNDYGLYDRTHGFDATTKTLCDVVRSALKQPTAA